MEAFERSEDFYRAKVKMSSFFDRKGRGFTRGVVSTSTFFREVAFPDFLTPITSGITPFEPCSLHGGAAQVDRPGLDPLRFPLLPVNGVFQAALEIKEGTS